MRSAAWTLVVAFCATVILGGSTCQSHIPVDPLPTTDPGGCAILPTVATHSGDERCGSAEPDLEPNGGLLNAVQLSSQACVGAAIAGRLASPDDADVFAIPNCNLPFLSSDLSDRRTQLPQGMVNIDDGSEVCLFASCSLGPTTLVGCPNENTLDASTADGSSDGSVFPAHLQEGMLGCCRRASGLLVTNVSCDDFSPQISGFIVARSVDSTSCHSNYSITFSVSPPPP
jgi:hypothetical protein